MSSRVGRAWEDRARLFFRQRGVTVLKTGYCCRFGELDLVCSDGKTLIVVEVRFRGRGSLVRAAESVDASKRRKLVRTTRHLLMTHPAWADYAVRFDVLAIDIDETDEAHVEWLRGAFDAE